MSLLNELAEIREKIASEKKPLFEPLPGYDKKLIGQYRQLTDDEIDELEAKARKLKANEDDEAEIKLYAFTLAEALVGFFTEVDGERVPLENALEGDFEGPIRYDTTLVRILGLDIESDPPQVQEIVRKTFERKFLLETHFIKVDRWMSRVGDETDSDF